MRSPTSCSGECVVNQIETAEIFPSPGLVPGVHVLEIGKPERKT